MVMTEENFSNNSFQYEMPIVRVPNPPSDLSYAEYEDYRQREILKANGISITEADLLNVLTTSATSCRQPLRTHSAPSEV